MTIGRVNDSPETSHVVTTCEVSLISSIRRPPPASSAGDGARELTGFGVVGLGVGGVPSPTRKRPDLCAEHGHPGVTYHPQMDKTWCLCGEVIRDGDHFQHAACCGGPLEEQVAERSQP